MKYIECPEWMEDYNTSVFLAGGITGCRDWQKDMVNALSVCAGLTVVNPRRSTFDTSNPNESKFQIRWEYSHLKTVMAVAFWFPPETLCPITLYELGKICGRKREKLFIGIHPEYKRKLDIEIQMELEEPGLKIVYSLEDLAKQIIDWNNAR